MNRSDVKGEFGEGGDEAKKCHHNEREEKKERQDSNRNQGKSAAMSEAIY